MKSFLFAILGLLLPGLAAAQELIPDGYCVIVVSSRPTLAAARIDAGARWADREVTIYRAKNGWFAVTTELVRLEAAEARLAQDKRAGRIPPDALCSRGSSYVMRVTRLPAGDSDRSGASAGASAGAGVVTADSLALGVDVAAMRAADKRFLQLSLAFMGAYHGTLDGDWGAMSAAALENYSLGTFDEAPRNWHLAILALEALGLMDRDGWRMHYDPNLQLSYLRPETTLRSAAPSDNFLNWEHENSTLKLSTSRSDGQTAQAIHDYVEQRHIGGDPAYAVRKPDFAVTRADLPGNEMLYVRSHYISGGWSSLLVAAGARDRGLLMAVASSIGQGRADDVFFEEDGMLSGLLLAALALAEDDALAPDAPAPGASARGHGAGPDPDPPGADSTEGSGSGIVVSADGKVLTNAHVIEGCGRVRVNDMPAVIIDSSAEFDLALLSVVSDEKMAFATFADSPAELNADVTVLGYPLSGLLSGLNVTRGAVSSAKGLSGDVLNMQITAPVQPGNSGGPVVDQAGRVVGVVVSKLDAQKVAEVIGDIPQNVNFAIWGEIARLYLFQNGVEPAKGAAIAPLDPVTLAKRASAFTVRVTCY